MNRPASEGESLPARESEVHRAYATDANAKFGGSGFIGRVELRRVREQVWLRGPRMSGTRVWAHSLGGVLRLIVWVAWLVYDWFSTLLDVLIELFSSEETPKGHHVWFTFKTHPETVSWSVLESEILSTEQVSRTDHVILLKAPIGIRGGMAKVYLEVAKGEYEAILGLLTAMSGQGGESRSSVDH